MNYIIKMTTPTQDTKFSEYKGPSEEEKLNMFKSHIKFLKKKLVENKVDFDYEAIEKLNNY